MPSNLIETLRTRVVVFDGAMGTQIHSRELDLEKDYLGCENCTDVICVSRPDVIESIHRGYLEAGADAVETNTFGSARHVLSEFGLEGRCFEINRRAAEIARTACDSYATCDRPRFVIGSMGPGTKLITLGQIRWEQMLASYREQVRGLLAGGVDALLVETAQDLLQAKCLVNACLAELDAAGKSPEDVPIMVSITIETMGTMLVGSTIEAALMALRQYPIASFGLNCATGPLEMGEHVSYLARHWERMISVMPNAGLPALIDGRTVYPLGPEAFADALRRFIHDEGVNIVGGCCGTTPAHIAELARIAHAEPAKHRTVSPPPASCSSLYGAVEYRQDQSFLIIGERCNASGSKKFCELLEAEDWDGMVSMARQQMREGSHLLDVNVDFAGRDNARDMAELVGRFAKSVDAPLMLDSTQVATIEAGLRCTGGKCLINSANFEDGEHKFDAICRLARQYGAGLVIGTIDEDKEAAMARTADRKLAIAERAINRATHVHGLDAADLFIDALVLPISTGMDPDRRSAVELIEGVRRISTKFPQVQLTCGVSNVSFGLRPAARVVLNSVFLHELVQAGLTSAIVHSSKILPLHRIDETQKRAALDLIYDRRHESRGGAGLPEGVTDEAFDPLQRLIELFKESGESGSTSSKKPSLTLEERLRAHIIDGEREGLTACLDEAMGRYTPLAIINDHLLDGMKTVGELFGSGQMQLPFVLQSAEVMKAAVRHLEPHMERVEGKSRGSIVLATVKGDVHDIGKNLVDIILSNNGFTVHNLGIKQPISDILAAWKKTNSDAIGLSGLLVKSVHVMEENIHEMNAGGVHVPLILGGAALSRHYAEGHLRSRYQGPLYFGRDAFEGLRLMQMISEGRLGELDAEMDERMNKRSEAEKKVAAMKAARADRGSTPPSSEESVRSDVNRLSEIPSAPFFGTEVVQGIDHDDIYAFINKIALFRGQWQFKKGAQSDEEYERQIEETAGPIFQRVCARGRDESILRPAVVYGYFPCASDGDHLLIFDPDDQDREIERFTFPRQTTKRRLCISDFFLDRDECEKLGRRDVIGLSCVTMGPRVSQVTRQLFERGEYTEYLYMHGLGVEAAEGLAELWHKRMRQQLGIGGDDSPRMRELFQQHYRGSRYSFGYPACPDIADQERLFRLLRPERIGCVLTENWQIDPEQSTSAIVVHHPQAKYFNV
ncbi:MAG: methionine synthase [Leptolyngbya sp. PLA3]|nr:MAG: methionine synthase [Cyanobacteria bacterium CYA]MCE7967549.1 methionine synthase [Leptolyngbya sp. PL-A3]